jgi:hypothetical protein
MEILYGDQVFLVLANFDLPTHLVFPISCCVVKSKLVRLVCLVSGSLLNVLVGLCNLLLSTFSPN